MIVRLFSKHVVMKESLSFVQLLVSERLLLGAMLWQELLVIAQVLLRDMLLELLLILVQKLALLELQVFV